MDECQQAFQQLGVDTEFLSHPLHLKIVAHFLPKLCKELEQKYGVPRETILINHSTEMYGLLHDCIACAHAARAEARSFVAPGAQPLRDRLELYKLFLDDP